MAQIQKFQTGTGVGGIQPSKLKFKIDGKDFEKDEQFVKDQFEPVFNELVASKKAKARDKDLWRNSFQQYLNQAKTGTYELESSAGEVLGSKYTGADGAELGTQGDGSTAKKTILGEVLSPRKQDDAQRMAFINGLVGNRLIGAYNSDTAASKAKAEADAEKLKGDKRLSALDRIKNFGTGFGNVSYGKDFASSPNLIMERWYDPKMSDSQRIASQSTYYGDQFKSLFDPTLDEYKDDSELKARLGGRSLDEVRSEAKKVYDPLTGKFTVQAKTLKDFGQYANVLDTMGVDNPFQDRSAWEKLRVASANSQKTPEQLALDQAEQDAAAARAASMAKPTGTGLFRKGNKTYTDAEGTQLADGFIGGQLWGGGSPYEGAYIGKNSVGESDYWGPQSGIYVGGKMAPKEQYEQHFRNLEKTGKYGNYLKMLTERRLEADRFADNLYGGDDKYQTAESIQDKDASDYILADYKNRFTHAQNITGQFEGLKDAAIAFVRDDKSLNRFGKPTVKNVIRIKGAKGQNPKTFSGTIKKDQASGNYIFIGEDGREIKEASAKLRGVKYNKDRANPTGKTFRLNLSNGEPVTRGTRAIGGLNYSYKEGGSIEKHQLGGNIGGIESSSATDKRHQQATVKDILDSTATNYNLSSLDKWELGALAGDLTGVIASLSGAGSMLAGGLGVASTATQFGVDIARDGVDAGDFGRLGMGLALDAASFVPGLGIASSTSKTIRTLGKAAKWLVPALTAAGVVNAAGIVKDVVSGKKGLTDLSVDDLRGLVNGIHGVMGTKRMLRQNLATENATVHSIQLKNGRKVPVTEADAAMIKVADDKVAAAKAAIAKNNPGMSAADIELAPTYKTNLKFWKGGFRTKIEDSNTNVLSNTSGIRIKSLDDYQGDSFSDRFMRNSINKAINRAPASMVKQYEADNKVNIDRKRFDSVIGDNFRKGPTITPRAPLADPLPEGQKMLPSPSGKPEMGTFTNRITQNATPRPVVDNTSPAEIVALRDKGRVSDRMTTLREAKQVKAAERAAIKQKEAAAEVQITNQKQATKKERQAEITKQLNMFNPAPAQPAAGRSKSLKRGDVISLGPAKKAEGGIIKAQGGTRIPFLPEEQPPMYDISRFLPQYRTAQTASSPFKPVNVLPPLRANNVTINPQAPVSAASGLIRNAIPSRATGVNTNLKSTSPFKRVGEVLSGVDPLALSELSRALWTRQQNSKIDTRVERPLIDAPAEVSVPVRGNMLLKQSFDNQANNVVQRAHNLPTSDAQLATIASLEANRNAGVLRAQGDIANAEAIDRSRGASLENEMRNSQARNAAANQNRQTLARATQAERGAENEKMARMNQPVGDFWKDQNYKAMVKQQQDKGIDTQIALTGKSGNFNLIQQPLQVKYSTNQQKMASGRLSEAEIAALQAENAEIEKQVGWLNNQYVTDSLLTRKDSKYVTPTDWYSKGMPIRKEGGEIKAKIQNQKEAGITSRAIVKQHDEFIKTGLQDETKKSLQTMKQIQELIKLALS